MPRVCKTTCFESAMRRYVRAQLSCCHNCVAGAACCSLCVVLLLWRVCSVLMPSLAWVAFLLLVGLIPCVHSLCAVCASPSFYFFFAGCGCDFDCQLGALREPFVRPEQLCDAGWWCWREGWIRSATHLSVCQAGHRSGSRGDV